MVSEAGDHSGVYVLELNCFSAHPCHAAVLNRRRGPLMRALRTRFPGLRRLELAKLGEGRWLHLGFWDTREGAEAAANEMFDMPEMSDWLAQVGEFADAA